MCYGRHKRYNPRGSAKDWQILTLVMFTTVCIWLNYFEIPMVRKSSSPMRWKMVLSPDAAFSYKYMMTDYTSRYDKPQEPSTPNVGSYIIGNFMSSKKNATDTLESNHSKRYRRTKSVEAMVRNFNQLPAQRKSQIEIVWYRPFQLVLKEQTRLVDMSKCEYKNCKITYSKITRINSSVIVNLFDRDIPGDVILFQANHVAIPFPNKLKGQIFVLVDMEAPRHLLLRKTVLHKPQFLNVFNWTMTYRRDSDIPIPYGEIVRNTNDFRAAEKDYREIFRRKQRRSVWIASHCGTSSKRTLYVELLQKYVTVDTYGACGQIHNCSKPREPVLTDLKPCELSIARSYMFYFSFENTICHDYVTEKVFRWFEQDIVLVVRGAPNKLDLLPKGSFINTADFNSTKELGEYLNRLSADEDKYIEYLKVKDQYRVIRQKQMSQNAYCELCAKANNVRMTSYLYHNTTDWLNRDMCVEPNDLL